MTYIVKNVAGKALRFCKESPRLQFFDNFQAVGGQLWPAGDILVDYFATKPGNDIIRENVLLELGSGCGYVGIGCGALGAAHVTLSDRLLSQKNQSYDVEGCLIEDSTLHKPSSILLDIIGDNIRENSTATESCTFAVEELQWGSDNFHLLDKVQSSSVSGDVGTGYSVKLFDVIVGSDLTYHSSISVDLFATVRELLSRNGALGLPSPSKFIVSHQHRLEASTQITLGVAQNLGLKKNELWEGESDKKVFSIWEFTL